MGGTYESGKFTEIKEITESSSFKAPSIPETLKLSADIRLNLFAVVHIVLYDLVPFEIELIPYVGLELAAPAPPDKCKSASTLHYGVYFGLDMIVRIARPITPKSWQISPLVEGLFDGVALACRTKDDAITAKFDLGSGAFGGKFEFELLAGGNTEVVPSVDKCEAQESFCSCMKDAASWRGEEQAKIIYLLRYPSQGTLKIVPKTVLAENCVGVGAVAAAGSVVKALKHFTQKINFLRLKVEDYKGELKEMYEVGYGISLRLYVLETKQYKAGVTIDSVAKTSNRREGTAVTFTTNGVEDEVASPSSAELVSGIEQAQTSMNLTVATPTAEDTALGDLIEDTPSANGNGNQNAAATANAGGDSGPGAIIGGVLGALVVLALGAGAAYYFFVRKSSSVLPAQANDADPQTVILEPTEIIENVKLVSGQDPGQTPVEIGPPYQSITYAALCELLRAPDFI